MRYPTPAQAVYRAPLPMPSLLIHYFLPHGRAINAFLEDTCVLVTLAYLLSRGPLLARLFDRRRSRRDQIVLAVLFGLIGSSDLLFPRARLPYVPSTLAACLAGYAGGISLGVPTAICMIALFIAAAVAHVAHINLILISGTALTAAAVGVAFGKLRRDRSRGEDAARTQINVPRLIAAAFIAGGLAELGHGAWRYALAIPPPSSVLVSAAANAFGCALLTFVLHDSYQRHQAMLRNLQSEREITTLRLSQLSQLQAKLHPHFLFNALATIAGLCVLRPSAAEQAVTDLASLLRRFLHAPSEQTISLREEMATVRTYLSLERMRMGDRLCVLENVPEEVLSCPVPRFCLQILVENAVQHGVAPMPTSGKVCIIARRHAINHLFLAVIDNGVGSQSMVLPRLETVNADKPLHGLTLLALRLHLTQPTAARMRLISRAGHGTLCAVRIPI